MPRGSSPGLFWEKAPDKTAEPAPPTSPAAPLPPLPEQRLTTEPPVPGPAEDAARKDWSDWWRTNPAAAESFLTTAAWSDGLKFRARAKAYSSAP